MGNILDNCKSVCEKSAQRWKVASEIHPLDFTFQFLLTKPSCPTTEKAIEEYFEDGFDSAQKLTNILKEICVLGDKQSLQLLEFASGYGRVTRHLKNVAPFCITTACDIHPQAVQFIREKLNTEAVLSALCPEDLHLNKEFDVVFALSFFSHMPKKTFSRWLQKLTFLVKPGGYFIFTTHGLITHQGWPESCQFDEEGFHFNLVSEQKDISTEEYGSACTMPKYVFSQILKIPKISIKYFQEGYWWGHQDVFCLRRLL